MKRHLQNALAWATRVQGEVVLPTARTIYLLIASISLLAAVLGIVTALVLEVMTVGTPRKERVPDINTVSAAGVDVAAIQERLRPPKNVRFIVTVGLLHERPAADSILGYFDADTANGLPGYPSDFSIVGGVDAALFERMPVSIPGALRAGLAPTPALAARIDANPVSFSQPTGHSFHIQVLARDKYGNSAPANVEVLLMTGPNVPQSVAAPAAPPVDETTELQRLAADIAGKADPSHGAAFFDIYKRAQRVPADCGADGDSFFLGEYRRAFESARELIKPGNTEGLFAGMCDAWRQSLANHSQALAQAEAERDAAITRNMAAKFEHDAKMATYKAMRNLALAFVGSALIAFITICLFLAFLAMENHSKAVREAIEAIARKQGATPEQFTPGGLT